MYLHPGHRPARWRRHRQNKSRLEPSGPNWLTSNQDGPDLQLENRVSGPKYFYDGQLTNREIAMSGTQEVNISKERWEQFFRDGYVYLGSVFNDNEIDFLQSASKAAFDEAPYGRNAVTNKVLDESRLIGLGKDVDMISLACLGGDVFKMAVEKPIILNTVVRLLGEGFYLSLARIRRSRVGAPRFYYHHDAHGGVIVVIVMYETKKNEGASVVVPGSHRGKAIPLHTMADINVEHPDEFQMTGQPGDVYLMCTDVDHARADNFGGRPNEQILINFINKNNQPLRQMSDDELSGLRKLSVPISRMLREYDGIPFSEGSNFEKLMDFVGYDHRKSVFLDLIYFLLNFRGKRMLPSQETGFPRLVTAIAYESKVTIIQYLGSIRIRSFVRNSILAIIRTTGIGRTFLSFIKRYSFVRRFASKSPNVPP
jgi:hypothetical protein